MVNINPSKLKEEIEQRKRKQPEKHLEQVADDGKQKHKVAAEILGYLKEGYTMSEILFEDEREKQQAEAVMPYVEMVMNNYRSVKRHDTYVELLIEYPVEIPELETRGIIDAAIVAPEALIVYDLKTGHAPVLAKEFRSDALVYNQQLMSYLLALSHLSSYPDTATCTGTISQPVLGHTDSFAVPLGLVRSWAVSMRETLSMDKIRGYFGKAVDKMTDEERLSVLQAKREMLRKCEEIEKYYLDQAEAGKRIPEELEVTQKIRRIITDEEEAARILKNSGYKISDFMKLKGIGDIENLYGSKEKMYESLSHLISLSEAQKRIDLKKN